MTADEAGQLLWRTEQNKAADSSTVMNSWHPVSGELPVHSLNFTVPGNDLLSLLTSLNV